MIVYDSYTDKFIDRSLETEIPYTVSDRTDEPKCLEISESGKTVNALEERVEELTRRVEELEKKLERTALGFPSFRF